MPPYEVVEGLRVSQKNHRAITASPDVERTILGAILLYGSLFSETANTLRPDDFSLSAHRTIYVRMCELMEADSLIDIITVTEELRRHEEIEAIGGFAYLSSLIDGVPDRPSIAHYVRIVQEYATRRRGARAGEAMQRLADEGSSSA